MKCPYCQAQNLIDARFCEDCGRPLSDDIPSYMLHDEPEFMDQVKDFFEEIKKTVTEKNYKEILSDRKNPVTNMIIVFASWLMLRTVGIIPFIILVRILAFLMGYVGLFFLMVMTYTYSTHQKEIMEKVEEIKGIDYRKTLREIVSSIEAGSDDEEDEPVHKAPPTLPIPRDDRDEKPEKEDEDEDEDKPENDLI